MQKKPFKLGFLSRDRLKDIPKDEDRRPTLKFFFKLFGRKFTDLLSLNFLMIPQILPVIVVIYAYFSRATVPAATSVLYPVLYGTGTVSGGASTSLLSTLFSTQQQMTATSSAVYYIIPIAAVFLLGTFGVQNAGATYVLRSMVRCESVSLFSDYMYAVKKNWKQAIPLGIVDCVIMGFLAYDALFFYDSMGSLATDIGFILTCVLAVLYLVMRFYLYLLLVTFDLKTRKILKNSFIFSILGFKRNFMAILGCVILFAFNAFLYLGLMQVNIAVGLILPLFYAMAFPAFIAAYAAYPIVKRYMIDPYYDENGNPLDK